MTQDEYIRILFSDCGYDTKKRQLSFVSSHLNKDISNIDELSVREKSILITTLKDQKNQLSFNYSKSEYDQD